MPETVNGLPLHPLVVHAAVVFIPLVFVLAILIVVLSIIAAIAANNGQAYSYPFTFEFVH